MVLYLKLPMRAQLLPVVLGWQDWKGRSSPEDVVLVLGSPRQLLPMLGAPFVEGLVWVSGLHVSLFLHFCLFLLIHSSAL